MNETRCERCGGSGDDGLFATSRCSECGGKGVIRGLSSAVNPPEGVKVKLHQTAERSRWPWMDTSDGARMCCPKVGPAWQLAYCPTNKILIARDGRSLIKNWDCVGEITDLACESLYLNWCAEQEQGADEPTPGQDYTDKHGRVWKWNTASDWWCRNDGRAVCVQEEDPKRAMDEARWTVRSEPAPTPTPDAPEGWHEVGDGSWRCAALGRIYFWDRQAQELSTTVRCMATDIPNIHVAALVAAEIDEAGEVSAAKMGPALFTVAWAERWSAADGSSFGLGFARAWGLCTKTLDAMGWSCPEDDYGHQRWRRPTP